MVLEYKKLSLTYKIMNIKFLKNFPVDILGQEMMKKISQEDIPDYLIVKDLNLWFVSQTQAS